MKKYITKNNLCDFITTNEKLLPDLKKIKGLVVEFPGSDGNSCLGGNLEKKQLDGGVAKVLASNNILMVFVFTGPWNWMRDITVNMVDEIIDAVKEYYSLSDDIRIVYTGGSMGGQGALTYNVKGKHKAIACAVSCPAADLFAIPEVLPWAAASLYFACAHYETDFDTTVKNLSPLYFVEQFPNIDYLVLYCDKDEALLYDKHALPLIEKMKNRGLKLQTVRARGAGHCVHPADEILIFVNFIVNAFSK